jgi:phenylacetate-coenzyme A ligase PaaK-like adenylate-forming protein
VMRVSMECIDPDRCDKRQVEERFIERFLRHKPGLRDFYDDRHFSIIFNFTRPGGLELYRLKGRPKRLIDRRGE